MELRRVYGMVVQVAVNYLSVLVGAIGAMVVGYVWYSKQLFGEEWTHLVGIKMKDMKGADMSKTMGLAFVGALLTAYVLYHFIAYGNEGVVNISAGLITAFWGWLGFVATTSYMMNMFQGKPMKLWLIDAGQHLVAFLVMGALMGLLG